MVRIRVSIFGVRDSISMLSLRCYSTAGRLVVSLGGRLPARYTRRKNYYSTFQQHAHTYSSLA